MSALTSIQNALASISDAISGVANNVAQILGIVQNNLDTTVSSRASQESVDMLPELKSISQSFTAAAGTPAQGKIITIMSTQFPVVIHSIYVQANLGTGTTAISGGENIRFDRFSIDGVTVVDTPNDVLIAGSDTAGSDRVLLSEEGPNEIQNSFPLGIDSNLELRLLLDSVGGGGAGDPDNGFTFTVIAVVEAPGNASITIS